MKTVLLVSIGFSPNVGGIETHFDDLVGALTKRNWKVIVLTYKPITTEVGAPFFEKRGINVMIYRVPWLGGIFYKLVKKPFVEFIYLIPGLFIALPVMLILKGRQISVIHSHGLIAGFVSVFWGKIFGKRVITTTHSIYEFPKSGFYRNFAKWIFGSSDAVLTLSKQSKEEMVRLGVDNEKVNVFTYWIDLKNFRPVEKAKGRLGWREKFVVLFVGRLVPEKGVSQLLDAAKIWNKNINLVVVGTGPLAEKVNKLDKENIKYLGRIDNKDLPLYYSAANLLIIPSVHEEGFGRVILESLACGTPVIGSDRGAIPEAMDKTVGELIDVTPKRIKKSVEYFYKNSDKLGKLFKNARKFAMSRYSEKNVETIIKSYQ